MRGILGKTKMRLKRRGYAYKAMLKNTEKLVLLNKTELGTDFPL